MMMQEETQAAGETSLEGPYIGKSAWNMHGKETF